MSWHQTHSHIPTDLHKLQLHQILHLPLSDSKWSEQNAQRTTEPNMINKCHVYIRESQEILRVAKLHS